jgi:TolB protein
MDAHGDHLTRLTADSAVEDLPSWSPDGRRIAFRSVRGDNYDVEVIRADGHDRTRLTSGPEYDGSLEWSPDGTQLAFISGRDGYDAVYVLTPGAAAPIRLTTQASLDPQWSP